MNHFFRNPKASIVTSILLLLNAIADPIIAYAYMKIGNNVFDEDRNPWMLVTWFLLIFLCIVLHAISNTALEYQRNKIGVNTKIKKFSNVLNLSISDFSERLSSSYYIDFLTKIDLWRDRYLTNSLLIIAASIEIVILVLFITSINFMLGVIICLLLLPLVINNLVFPKMLKKQYDSFFDKQGQYINKMKEYLDGFSVIRNLQAEQHYLSDMSLTMKKSNRVWQKKAFLGNISGFFAYLGVTFSQLAGILVSIFLLSSETINFGEFLALVQMTLFINEPVIRLINAVLGHASTRKLNKEINEGLDKEQCFEMAYKNNFNQMDRVKIQNLNYSYDGKRNVFDQAISIDFKRSDKILLVGESGSGKTTILKILLKSLVDYTGEVYINGVELRDISEMEINKLIAYIPQRSFLFNDTIRNNIDIHGELSETELENIIEITNLHKVLANSKNSLDSIVGEEISQLSGGEKTRICIARALATKRSFIVADEILANLDQKNRFNIEKLLLDLEGITVIHIAHNSSPALISQYSKTIDLGDVTE